MRWSASSPKPATESSRPRWRERSWTTWRRCANATSGCARTRMRSSRCSPTEPAARVRSPPRRWPRCGSAWASARPVSCGRYREAPMSLAAFELDLEVFTGPFDLLLALVLREAVDLLELSLADVVISYLDHLEGRGELDLETTTEFI